ncbi:ricin-type beta-trefoil lectin domain protein [Actinomadura rayongensis]|uniref:DNRLRE domain-containing protein n=1 Tax=Actinomadura rayongensis TaxID=1429076 RepID=A0A6I4WH16_9ACTN|nr:RICIN domain-containing protein [Actinomadura rayongensis]MXQ65852.1 DNRLRE domain-containing protein [Actinomadura rayongensis]
MGAAHAGRPPSRRAPVERGPRAAAESARALARAKATGQSVELPSATTGISTTTANPDGTFTTVQSLLPQRVWQSGRWRTLDPTLHADPGHGISPAVSAAGLQLSAGGSGPLATLTTEGHRLSLTWPTALPAPEIDGASATYPDVLPDVDLIVTVTPQGAFSDTLAVKTAEAAKNPALSQLKLTIETDGLEVSTDPQGNLQAVESADGLPVFSAVAPTMWDSSTNPPAGVSATAVRTATPSSATAPGSRARVGRIRANAVTTSRRPGRTTAILTLRPDRALLTGRTTAYPVYLDPTWTPQYAGSKVQASAEVQSYFDSQHYWNPSTLQMGYCGWDSCYVSPSTPAHFVARSFLRMSVPSQLQNNAHITSSQLNVTFKYGPYNSCSGAPNPTIDLGWTGTISTSTTWNNQPSWKQTIDTAAPAACSGARAGFDLTSFMQSHAAGASSMTFGLKAADSGDKNTWKQFVTSDISMSTTYDHAPDLPGHPATSPGGPCQTSGPGAVVIGNDDVKFQVVPTDRDGGQLGTRFVVKNYGGSTVYDSGDPANASTALTVTSGQVASLTLKRSQIQGWHADGRTKPYQYSWYTVTSDGKYASPGTGTGSAGSPCAFTYDPTQPPAPGLAVATDANGNGGTLGGTATVTLAPCADLLADPATTCTGTAPNRYKYQLNSGAPVTVTASGGAQTVTVPLHHAGPNALTVFSISAGGNPGESASAVFTVAGPASPYPDGDVDGDPQHRPDLLTIGGGAAPGLWLASGDGAGGLATPTDIGAAGTGVQTAGSPGDWTGVQVLHGDFTGNHVQDVLAYYPSGDHQGSAYVLSGNGDALPLLPVSGEQVALPAGTFADPLLDPDDEPLQLVAAGNAGLQSTGVADLIGIVGDAANGYQLDLYSTCGGCGPSNYTATATLAAKDESPDGAADWNNFTLVTAQPNGIPVLFAVKRTTGETWESTNPNQSATALIGTAGTWTKITAPWGSAPPTPISGDVNAAGKIELWGRTGSATAPTATPYTLTGTSLAGGTATNLLIPAHQWPLTSSGGATASCAAAVCTPDTTGGQDAAITGGVTLADDPTRGTVADLDGSSGYITLPTNLLHASNVLTIGLSFRADPGTGGILFSTGNDVPSTPNANAMPVMYIGTDGKLYAQFWNGGVTPMISPQRVDDGQWHTVLLNSTGNHQGFYLDNDLRIGMAGSQAVNNADPLVFVGAGTFPPNTDTRQWVNAPGDTTRTRSSYFNGQISNVMYFASALSTAQMAPYWKAAPMVGPIVSALSAGLCVDNNGGTMTNKNKVQIWTCNNRISQNWSLNPDETISMTSGGTTMCLDVTESGTANGTLVQLYTCNGTVAQMWHLDSSGQIWNPNAGKCLDDPKSSTTSGTQLQIYDCNLTKAQYWIVP